MRIPTKFEQRGRIDRSPRFEQRGAMRRLLRLVVALVLVIVVMDAARNPAIYRPFFGSQTTGRTPAEPGSGSPGEPAMGPVDTAGTPSPTVSAEGPYRESDAVDLARQLIPLLSQPQRETLTALLAWQRHPNATARQRIVAEPSRTRAVIDAIEQAIDSLQSGLPDEGNAWQPPPYAQRLNEIFLAASESASPENDQSEPSVPSEGDATALSKSAGSQLPALQYALDETYQREVVDGAVWSAGDADAFYRYLEGSAERDFGGLGSATEDAPADLRPIRVGVVPLVQQPAIYQGRMVWMNGTVVRAARLQAKGNPFGVRDYWEVWVRPADGTERPVLLYASEVPAWVAAVGPEASLQQGPELSLVGLFLKRRLFQAVGGPQLAPVIVGRVSERPASDESSELATASSDTPSLWLLLVIAAAAGVGLAAWLCWQSARSARRSRELRHKRELGTLALSGVLASSSSPDRLTDAVAEDVSTMTRPNKIGGQEAPADEQDDRQKRNE